MAGGDGFGGEESVKGKHLFLFFMPWLCRVLGIDASGRA
jgi:hypothetical protein